MPCLHALAVKITLPRAFSLQIVYVLFLSAPIALFNYTWVINTKYQYHTKDSMLYCLEISSAKEISPLLNFRQVLRMRAEGSQILC